jgi:rhamnosyltransferase
LQALLCALRPQVDFLVLVDNASSLDVAGLVPTGSGIEFRRLEQNIGLAAAQNLGIERALEFGADYVLISDQDSLPPVRLVQQLAAAFEFPGTGAPVAAVGPMTVDARTGVPSFFVVERHGHPQRYRPQHLADGGEPRPVEVAFLIASGSLLSADAIRAIGAMRSRYFIDHIDTEWCFRARRAGYRLLGVPAACIEHRLGDSVRKVWFFGWRQVMAHSPLRDYYMFRNTLLMLSDTPMRLTWRLHFLWRLLQFGVYFLGFTGDRWLRSRHMLLGLWHGLKGQGGRLDPSTGACVPLPASSLEPGGRRAATARTAPTSTT